MDIAIILAGAGAMALVVQRQRVLARRIARLERRVATAPPGRTRHVVTLRATGFHPQTAARFAERELRRMQRAGG